jgi:hypothetical protein
MYARNGRIPFDTTPGGHRRFDIEEVRTALAGRQRKQTRKGPAAHPLLCAVCLYVSEGAAAPAVTVINGLAVCEDHAEHAMDTGELWRIIAAIRKEHQ